MTPGTEDSAALTPIETTNWDSSWDTGAGRTTELERGLQEGRLSRGQDTSRKGEQWVVGK